MYKNWISLHIFYYGDQNDLIVQCVSPLIEDLRSQKLIESAFFIRYWMEGSHVRLRLLPATGADTVQIKSIAEQALTVYLKRRPALYTPDHKSLVPFYKDMFIAEYSEEKWAEQYGENGTMPMRANNSFHYIEYEPEGFRYGGPEGVALAEWHFDHSSDIIIKLLRDVNVRVPTILLGISVQLSLPLFYGFFETDQAVISALDGYIKFWQSTQGNGGMPGVRRDQDDPYGKHYLRMASDMQQRILKIRQYMTGQGVEEHLTPIEYAWKSHIVELRRRVDALFAQGKITFEGISEERQPSLPDQLQNAYRRLLGSYVHMTNNRLGVSIPHEVYLSYLSKRSLEDMTLNRQEEIA